MAIEASKAALDAEDLAGPSRQAEVPQDVGTPPEEMERDETEEGAELLEWGANNPATQDVSSGDELESWEPRHRVMARFNPRWTSLPAPRVTGEAFLVAGRGLGASGSASPAGRVLGEDEGMDRPNRKAFGVEERGSTGKVDGLAPAVLDIMAECGNAL
ncbi:hypothetical protein C0993_000814 [Termitomyces sp. T159_Od127]|nr:hypothetical protein C0993_000814 [Termitomyces sp. T159_Od127]